MRRVLEPSWKTSWHSLPLKWGGAASVAGRRVLWAPRSHRLLSAPPTGYTWLGGGGAPGWNLVLGHKSPPQTSEDVREAQWTWRGAWGLANFRFFQRLVFSETENVFWLETILWFVNPCACAFFFFLNINCIHMFLIYFYLTHQIELEATMMNGNNVDFQEDFWALFLRT